MSEGKNVLTGNSSTFSDWLSAIGGFLGFFTTLVTFFINFKEWTQDPQTFRYVSIAGFIVYLLCTLWFVFKVKSVNVKWRRFALVLLYISTAAYLFWVGTWWRHNIARMNRLITYHDFEGTDNGWSEIASQEFGTDDETIESEFPKNSSFPGSMRSEITTNYALTGRSSLKVTTSVNKAGSFKSYLYREGAFTGNGVTIYVMTPKLVNNVPYIHVQLCIPSHGWPCSNGTRLLPGEWTPITIDLSVSDDNDIELYEQKLTKIAVQWRFYPEAATSLELYFDSVEFFHAGP